MAKRWIQKAVNPRTKGVLRAKAKRRGLIKGTESMSESDLDRLHAEAKRRGDTKTMRQVQFARNVRK